MKLARLKAIAVKEMLQIWRDPRSLLIALAMPAMQMLLLGYGVNLDIKHIPLCTFDREASQHSQALLKRFQATYYFSVTEVVQTYPALITAIDAGSCKLGIIVPPNFSERLSDTGTTSVQAIADATDDNTANLSISYAQAVVSGFSSDVQLWWAAYRGTASGCVGRARPGAGRAAGSDRPHDWRPEVLRQRTAAEEALSAVSRLVFAPPRPRPS